MKKALDYQVPVGITVEINDTATIGNFGLVLILEKSLINADSEKKSEERLLKWSSLY